MLSANEVNKSIFYFFSILTYLLIFSCASEKTEEVVITPPVIQKFTLIVNASEGGSVSTLGGEYVKGSTVIVTATPNQGYVFSGWTGNSSSDEATINLTVEGNISLTANFEPIIDTFTVTLVALEGGNVSGAGEFSDGTEVEISATPNEGYRFVDWSDGVSENTRTLTVNSDITLAANFEIIPLYSLTIITSEGGTTSIESGEYLEGSILEITASADENYEFISWTDANGDLIGEDLLISITINDNFQIQANFALIVENITFSNPILSSGVLSGEFSIDYEITGDFSGIVSKGVFLNDSLYSDEINENKISLSIDSLEYQEYSVKFFIETQSNTYESEIFSLTPEVICPSVELVNSNMSIEQEFCTYESISLIQFSYTGTSVSVQYDEDSVPYGIDISNNNGVVEISGTPIPMDSDSYSFDINFIGLGECEGITKTITFNRSPNSPKLILLSGSLSQTITAGGQIEAIEFEYAGSAEGFTFSDLPDGLSYSITGTTYRIEGNLNTAGSYTSTITTVNQSGCSELSESFSFEVNQPVSSGGGGGSSGSSSSQSYSDLQTSIDVLEAQVTNLLVSLASTNCDNYSSALNSSYDTYLSEYNSIKDSVDNSSTLTLEQNISLTVELVALKTDLDASQASLALYPCQKTYVPDDNFEQVLIDNGFDDVLDDYVLTSNISGITCFSSPEQRTIFHEKGITDMTGIQDFTSLKFLSLYGNPITSIDVSSLSNLGYIDLGNTNITSVDLTNNSQLTTVRLYNNTNLTSVNVTGLSNLRILALSGVGNISSVNVSSSDKLTQIDGLNTISCITVSQSQLDNQVNGGIVPADYTTNSLGQRTYNFYDSCDRLNAPAIGWGNDSHKSKFNLSCN